MYNSRETINGILAGIVTPFLFFFIIKGIDTYIVANLIDNWQSFTLKFYCVISIVANIIPFQIFNRQKRTLAMQGVVIATFILIAGVLIYFRRSFYG